MQNIKIGYLLPAMMLAVGGCFGIATAAKVTAKLDSVSLLMGRVTEMRLQVVQNEGEQGRFPMFDQGRTRYIGVCGDSVELSPSPRIDTVALGSGKMELTYHIGLQSFDSGYYKLPEIAYVVGKDTTWSNSVHIQVVPVKAEAEDPIADFARESDAAGSHWTDALPDWLYYYWWALLIGLMAIAAGVWILLRRRKGVSLLPAKPIVVIPPHEVALERLRKLKEQKLWEKGMEKEYFTELTDILRTYLDKRFNINAMEMTSRQIMQTLSANPEVRDKRQLVRQILDMADFVKFAKVRPLPADNVAAYDNAVRFVEETLPSTENPDKVSVPDEKDASVKSQKTEK